MKIVNSRVLKYSVGAIIVGIGVVWLLKYIFCNHHYEFTLNHRYDVALDIYEKIAFLDKPCEFCLKVSDNNSSSVGMYEFFTGSGPNVRFMVSPTDPDIIVVKGYDRNTDMSMIISLSNDTVMHFEPTDPRINGLITTHEIDSDFRLTILP